jgi:pantetheine-phosphate adenylyltransferase
MTLGHKDVVGRAIKLFDRIIVAIMINPDKKGKFSFAERKKIAELTLAEFPQVTVITADGYLADLASALKAVAIVKGVRNTDDFEYEQDMAIFNHDRNPVTETVYLPAYSGLADVSSTYARKLIDADLPLDGVIASEAIEYIKELKK